MKTAMQQFVENNFYIDGSGDYQFKWEEDTPMTDEINEVLEKEKEQIKKANMDGYIEGCTYHSFDHRPKTTEQYYNETYQNK